VAIKQQKENYILKSFHLNEQIARLRKKNNMTQEKFASLIGVSNQAVSKWEAGACCPDIQLLPAIADYFGVSIDALFTSDDYESRSRLMTLYECTNRDEDFATALDAYEKVILSGNETTKDRNDYALMFRHRGITDIEKAEKLYESALKFGEHKRDEGYYLVHTGLINLLCWRGRTEECITRYAERMKGESDNWWGYYLLSLAFMQSKKTEDAWQITKKALNQFESNFYLNTIAGDLCGKLGKYDDALTYWEKAYAENPKQISCLYSEAFLFEQLGRKQAAVDAWQRIVRWHHENDLYQEHETDMPLKHIEILLANNK
jgi:transcriptional regulator with XRE-family HTH domain